MEFKKSQKSIPEIVIMKAVGSDAINMAIKCCHNSFTKFCYERQIDAAEFTKVCQHETECKYNTDHTCIWVNMYGPVYCGFMKKLGLTELDYVNDYVCLVGSPEDRVGLMEKVFRFVYIKSRYENLHFTVPQMLLDEHAKGLSIINQFKVVSKSHKPKKSRKINARRLSMKTVLNLVSQHALDSA